MPIAYFEKEILPHSPDLYAATGEAPSVTGLAAVDNASLVLYEKQGFLLIRRAIPDDMAVAAKQELQGMTEAVDPDCESVFYEGSIRSRIQESGTIESIDALADLPADLRKRSVRKFMGFLDRHLPLSAAASYPPLVDVIARLAGESVHIFQDMALIKPPGGREKPWHQDQAYFNLALDTHIVGAWIALDETTEENGCMYLIPAGHLDGPWPHFARRDWQLCDEQIVQEVCLSAPMSAGDVLLFDAKLPHGTPTNQTDDWRWALQFHFAPQSAREVDDSIRLEAFGAEGKDVSC